MRGRGCCLVDVNVSVRRRVSTRRREVVCESGVEFAVVYGAGLRGRTKESLAVRRGRRSFSGGEHEYSGSRKIFEPRGGRR